MAKNTWKQIKEGLSNQLPGHTISTWFDPINPVAIDGNDLILEVPSQFFYDWIESHYRHHINKSIETLKLDNVSTKFIISAETQEIKTDEKQNLTPVKKSPLIPVLNKEHSFESFIEGSNNQFAKTAAEAVAENPGKQSFNPLIIYGGTGLGKTHLLHAIGNRVLETQPDRRIVIATSEKFTLDFVNGLRKNRTIEFAQQYRRADILLVDDIQFFRGKEQTQEQFFHTFNELHQAGKQIVLTADRYPGEMQGLQDRLLSRFQSGLSVDIQPPDFEVRVAILMDKAERNGVDLPYDIIEFIATHIKSNIRDLEGTIIRILAKSSLMNRDIDFSLAKEVVKERAGNKLDLGLSSESIINQVSDVFGVAHKDIVGKSRRMEIVQARQVAMYLCRNLLDTSLSSIGVSFGGRDHTTVIHAIKTIEQKGPKNPGLDKTIKSIEEKLSFISS
mgnify:CR=1 FL=1